MNEQMENELILKHLLGQLVAEDALAFEQLMAESSAFRERVRAAEAGLEERVLQLASEQPVSDLNFGRVRDRLMAAVAADAAGDVPDTVIPFSTGQPKGKKGKLPGIRPLWYACAGLAAVLAVWLSLPRATNDGMEVDLPSGVNGGPAIVVYDIMDLRSLELDQLPKQGKVREILYVKSGNRDMLVRAEAYAEYLWAEYLQRREKGEIAELGRGFVVLDLLGKQGFAGFYERNLTEAPGSEARQVRESFWFAGNDAATLVPVGDVDAQAGVFYFRVEAEKLRLAPLDTFVPVTRMDSI
jgi:hypothetical protein